MTKDPSKQELDSEPTGELNELSSDLNPVADLTDTLSQINSRYLTVLLLSYLVAMGVGTLTVLINPVRDWLLFGGMFLVILAYIILYLKSHQKKRTVLRLLSLVISEILIAFWVFILVDRIPERMVFIEGEIQIRPALTLLWVPVVLLCIVAIGMVVHWAYVGRIADRDWREPSIPA